VRFPMRPLPTRTVLVALVVAGGVVALPAMVGALPLQEDPSTSDGVTIQPTTPTQPTTPPTQPTTPPTRPPTSATTRPTTPTTQPTTSSSTTSSSTTSSSSTTTTTPSTTTAADTDEDGGSGLDWLLWVVLGLVVLLALLWLLSAFLGRRRTAGQWEQRRQGLLDEARHVHDGSVDLLARWTTLQPEQLRARWSDEMAQIERLRSHSSSLLARAPTGSDTQSVENLAAAVDDLHVALGNADLGAPDSQPPPYAVDTCALLDQAINDAHHPAARR
jgi:hypothetical protein